MTQTKELTYGELIRLALETNPDAPQVVDSEHLIHHAPGGQFAEIRLPWTDRAALAWDDIDSRTATGRPDFPLPADDGIFDLFTVIPVTDVKGSLPVGSLPAARILAGDNTATTDADPGAASIDYSLGRTAETRSSYSAQLNQQAQTFGDYVDRAQVAAIRRAIVTQALTGSGVAHNVRGLSTLTGVHEATYDSTGASDDIVTAVEAALVDAEAVDQNLVWVCGSTLHSQLLGTNIHPPGDRKIVERGRMVLSAARVFRSPAIPPAMGVCLDPANVLVIAQSPQQVILDRLSTPGTVKVTRRLPFDVRILRPAQIARLTEAP